MKVTAYLLLMLDTANLNTKPTVISVGVYGEPRPTIMCSRYVTAELARATADTYEEAKAQVLRQMRHHAWLGPLLR
jgi:hypothetical protein